MSDRNSETSLTIVRRIKAPPHTVFDAFVDPDKIALWWGPDAGPVILAKVEPHVGGRFHVRFRMEDGSEHGSTGTFAVFEPPHRLAMSWAWDDDADPDSHVEVGFRPVEGGTEVTFTHSRLPGIASRDSHKDGWNGAFDKLEAKAEELRMSAAAPNSEAAIELYGHPFAAYAWKALIAAYERGVPFVFRMVDPDHPENARRIAQLSPTGQFPAIVHGSVEVTQSNAVIDYLDRIGSSLPLVPADPDAALRARMLAEVFDNYVNRPEGDMVANALRKPEHRDPSAETRSRAMLDKSYAWLEARIGDGWAVGDAFSIADCAAAPALFYADWVHRIPPGPLADYRARLLVRPSVERVVDEARPYRKLFPLGAPDRD